MKGKHVMLSKRMRAARLAGIFCLAYSVAVSRAQSPDPGGPAAISPDPALQPDFDNGSTIYDNACAACHGETGQGGQSGGPALTGNLGLNQTMKVIHEGRNTMPAFDVLSDQELMDISAFVVERMQL